MKNRVYWMIAVLSLVAFVTIFNYGGCNPPGGDGSGSSGSSVPVTPPYVPSNPPFSPSFLVANAISSSTIYISWSDNSNNEYNFEIWRKTDTGGTSSRIATPSADITSYTDTELSTSTTYYYKVRAVGAGGDSSYSNEAWATTQVPPLFPPAQVGTSGRSPTNGATDVSITTSVSWASASGADSYDVYFGISSPGTFIGKQAGTSYNPGTLSISTTYYWRIDSRNSVGPTTGIDWSFNTGVPNTLPEEEFFLGLNFLSAQAYAAIPLASPPIMGIEDLPTELDISGKMPTPGNQKTQGSCVGWAVAYALKTYQEGLERNWSLSESNHLFSPSYIYNQINIGRLSEEDSGSYMSDALNLLTSEGCATSATMSYNENDFLTQPSAEARSEAAQYKAVLWRTVNFSDRAEVKKWLVSNNPLPISIWIGTNFSTTNMINTNYIYKSLGNKIRDKNGNLYYGGHAVTLVGYSDSKSAFKIINSWGTGWGDNGYGWIDYDFFPQACREAYYIQDDTTGVPAIEVTPSSLSFSDVSIGSTKDMPFTVKNIGTGILEGSASGLSEPFSFVVMPEYYLGAEQSTTIMVRFAPTTAGDSGQIVSFTGGGGSSNGVSGSGKDETVSTPNQPTGLTEGIPNTSYSYSTGGASSSLSHSVQYQFDWGDGTTSSWGSTTQSKSWSSGGTYTVKAQARCSSHTSIISTWSSGLTVKIETVSTPNKPSGATEGYPSTSYSYSTGGASSNISHSLQYRFDWGDGTTSSWGSTTQSKSWSSSGTYTVKAQARCTTHTSVVSNWSSGLTVYIETVSIPYVSSSGETGGLTSTNYNYSASGASSSLGHSMQYQFDWGDGTTSSWGSATQTKSWSTASNSNTYSVKVRARCSTHTTIFSGWSSGYAVRIISGATQYSNSITDGYMTIKIEECPVSVFRGISRNVKISIRITNWSTVWAKVVGPLTWQIEEVDSLDNDEMIIRSIAQANLPNYVTDNVFLYTYTYSIDIASYETVTNNAEILFWANLDRGPWPAYLDYYCQTSPYLNVALYTKP